jgi:hypothetical protein
VVAIERATPDDLAAMETDTALFFAEINATDGNPLELLSRLLPHEVVAVEVDVGERYDQSPGPSAGSSIGPGS